MSLVLERFGTLELPLIEAQQDIGAIGTRTSYTNLPGGGGYDNYGSSQAPRGVYSLSASGELMGETQAEVLTQSDALRAKRGRRAKLYARVDDESVRWVWARLRDVSITRRPEHVLFLPVALQFDVTSPVWYGDRHGAGWVLDDGEVLDTGLVLDEATDDVFVLTHSILTAFEVVNAGNAPINNAILTITAGSADMTDLEIYTYGNEPFAVNGHLTFAATIPAAGSLVIDAGRLSITNSGIDAYDDLTIEADHTLPGWVRLDPGATVVTIEFTSTQNATATFSFHDGYE